LRAEKVQGADEFAGHHDRNREYAADLVVEHGGAVRRPPTIVAVGEVGNEDRGAQRDGVQARALAEGELEFVIHTRGRAAGAQCSAGGPGKDQ
jgi:hypothetical protein